MGRRTANGAPTSSMPTWAEGAATSVPMPCRSAACQQHGLPTGLAMATIDGWIVDVVLPAIARCGQHLADREW